MSSSEEVATIQSLNRELQSVHRCPRTDDVGEVQSELVFAAATKVVVLNANGHKYSML